MAFIEHWRAQIPGALTEVAQHLLPDQQLDIGLLAVSMFWPVRDAIQRFDGDASSAVQQIAADDSVRILEMVRTWPGDRRAAAQATSAAANENLQLSMALQRVAEFFGASKLLSTRIVEQVRPGAGATVFFGEIKAALLNVGGTINIATLMVQLPVDEAIRTAEQLRAALDLLATMPLETVPSVAPLPTPHRMELRSKPFFVGRTGDLQALARTFKNGKTVVL